MTNEFPIAKYAGRSVLGRLGTIFFRLAIFISAIYLAYAIASALSFLFVAVYYVVAFIFLVLSFVFTLGTAYLSGKLSVDKIFINFDEITALIEKLWPYLKYAVFVAMGLCALAILFTCLDAPSNKKKPRIILSSVLLGIGAIMLVICFTV